MAFYHDQQTELTFQFKMYYNKQLELIFDCTYQKFFWYKNLRKFTKVYCYNISKTFEIDKKLKLFKKFLAKFIFFKLSHNRFNMKFYYKLT